MNELQDLIKPAILKSHDSEFNSCISGQRFSSILQVQIDNNMNIIKNDTPY